MTRFLQSIFFISFLGVANLISAQTFTPTRTIEIIVPNGPGGNASNQAHFISELLTKQGWNTAVVNKPGADQALGANYAAKAKPDGYTLLLGSTGSIVSNVAFKGNSVEYNEQSFAPVIKTNHLGVVLAVPYNSPIKNYEQFKFYVKNNPEKFSVGSFNANYANVLLQDILVNEGLPTATIIPYKGSAQVVADLVGNHLPFALDVYTTPLRPMVLDRRVRILAVLDNTGIKEIQQLNPMEPVKVLDVSKSSKGGYHWWNGVFVPAGTPKNIIAQLNAAINRQYQQLSTQEKEKASTIVNISGSPDDFEVAVKDTFKSLNRLAKTYHKP
jgi:tripartite-type tricarboxylate transporter receptor subunit TctC